MKTTQLAKQLHPLERKILPALAKEGTAQELVEKTSLQEVEVIRALQWLSNKGALELTTQEVEEVVVLERGQAAQKNGLPEVAAFAAIKKAGELGIEDMPMPDYDTQAKGSIIGALKKAGIPFITTSQGKRAFKYVKGVELAQPIAQSVLDQASKHHWRMPITQENKDAVDDLLKRQGYAEKRVRSHKHYVLSKLGEALKKEKISDNVAERLTVADLKSGAWQNKEYRAYDVTINVPAKVPGKEHFVNEAIDYIKQVWLELGFQEMEGNKVQTAFWCLDSLFVPQDHPAREMQDTFYLQEPASAAVEKDVFTRIKDVHENGGDTGSTGWQYSFSKEETEQLLLRTHTTVLSAQTLDLIREGKKGLPGKYFAVSKNFRNEALDWKHLFEFYQVEGIVVDPNANFTHLLGYLELFFKKLGYEKVRVRPAHFPYTEPSVEIEGWHPRKKQWVELGGAGLFRPEVTKTLIGKEVPVLAWGLGMERSISEYFGITDIRELYNNDLKLLRSMKKWVK